MTIQNGALRGDPPAGTGAAPPPPPFELFVPGRLCIAGEHTDWAGAMRKYNPDLLPGRTIVAGLEYGLHARVSRLDAPLLRLRSTTDGGKVLERELPLDEDVLAAEAQAGGFFSYACGVAYYFWTEFRVGGLEIDNHTTTLPLKKGLSSSAAMCVLVARGFNRAYGLGLSTRGEMALAFAGERLTPSQCGRMDQAVAFGSVPVVMEYSGDVLKVRPAALGATLHLVLVDLCAAKDTVRILEALQQAYPHPTTPQEKALVDLLGRVNEEVTARTVAALAAGDAAAVGALMIEWQRKFDKAAGAMCPDQLGEAGSPVLHTVLGYPAIQRFIHGGKGVGSQGDGSAQLVCKGPDEADDVCRILEQELRVHCMRVDLRETAAGGGDAACGGL